MEPDEVQRIDQWIREHQDELLEFLSRLVQIPSEVKPPAGNELACQRFVEQVYRAVCDQVDVFDPLDVPGLREHPAYRDTLEVFRGAQEKERRVLRERDGS